ncbi:MAG: hypothetical protein ABDH28_06235 [Brevinematia bacterium]
MLLEITKPQGEYIAEFSYDPWVSKIILCLTNNEEFKSFVLENYISANKNFLELKNVLHHRINDNLIILDGKEINFIANDNIFLGKITLVSESFSSLRLKTEINTSLLPQDYTMEIKNNKVEITYRNPVYSLKILSFLLLRKIGIIPSEIHIESLYPSLFEVIPLDSKFVRVDIVKFSRYILPHKVTFSISVSTDTTNYYSLVYSKGKWRIRSSNFQKGAVNQFHKFILNLYHSITELWEKTLEKWKWLNTIQQFLKQVRKKKLVKMFFILASIGFLTYLMLKSKLVFILVTMYFLYLLLIRISLYINFKGKVI